MQAFEGSAGTEFSVTSPDVLGADLARAVIARAGALGESAVSFARALSLDPDRVHAELTYLSILTTQFAVGVALGSGETKDRVSGAFERSLWLQPWRATPRGLAARVREYKDAFNHPHPELGRSYVVGRTFARHCGCGLEIAAIEFGARAYMEQLSPVLGLLRSVTVA